MLKYLNESLLTFAAFTLKYPNANGQIIESEA